MSSKVFFTGILVYKVTNLNQLNNRPSVEPTTSTVASDVKKLKPIKVRCVIMQFMSAAAAH